MPVIIRHTLFKWEEKDAFQSLILMCRNIKTLFYISANFFVCFDPRNWFFSLLSACWETEGKMLRKSFFVQIQQCEIIASLRSNQFSTCWISTRKVLRGGFNWCLTCTIFTDLSYCSKPTENGWIGCFCSMFPCPETAMHLCYPR